MELLSFAASPSAIAIGAAVIDTVAVGGVLEPVFDASAVEVAIVVFLVAAVVAVDVAVDADPAVDAASAVAISDFASDAVAVADVGLFLQMLILLPMLMVPLFLILLMSRLCPALPQVFHHLL
jgi:hypothetical protein